MRNHFTNNLFHTILTAEPLASYKDRIFTTNSVGFAGVPHITEMKFQPLIEKAKSCAGFSATDCSKKTSTADSFLIGFGHHTVLSVADKVVDAVKSGDLKNIFVIGGCDGRYDYVDTIDTHTFNCSIVECAVREKDRISLS